MMIQLRKKDFRFPIQSIRKLRLRIINQARQDGNLFGIIKCTICLHHKRKGEIYYEIKMDGSILAQCSSPYCIKFFEVAENEWKKSCSTTKQHQTANRNVSK